MSRLTGKVALVTGAGGGIGAEVCATFLAEGASVVAADLDVDAARRAVSAAPGRVLAVSCDVSADASVERAVAAGVQRFGALHVLCGLAGGSSPSDGPVADVDPEEFWRVMKVDLFGTFLLGRHGLPELVRSGGGSMITMASMAGLIGHERNCYSAAKGGVIALTRSMALSYAGAGIRVNAIAPGITMSDRVRKNLEGDQRSAARASRHLLGLVEPVDVALMAVYLASDEARRVTGQVLSVDSGLTIH